jgi:hypothetical protein
LISSLRRDAGQAEQSGLRSLYFVCYDCQR